MNQKAQSMLNALLAISEHREELLPFLPFSKDQETVKFKSFNLKALFSATAWLDPIHFSWFTQTIQNFPPALRPHFLGLLSQQQSAGVIQMLDSFTKSHPVQPKKLSSFLRVYLAFILKEEMLDPDLLSEQELPPSLLNVLLQLERRSLLHLCQLLGIHDLATDLRQVVDKKLLKEIYNLLTPEQLQFLHYASKQTIRWVSPKLGLASWDGSKQQLDKLLHYRGLIRLAKAIAQEDESFKWHLLHRFDTGRAKIIQKELYKKQDPTLLSYFKNQILHIVKSGIKRDQ